MCAKKPQAMGTSSGLSNKRDACECYDIVTGLILCDIPQFTRVVSNSVTRIPDGFVVEHGSEMRGGVFLEPYDANGRQFKVMVTTTHVGKQEMTSFGEGWQEFGATNKLQGGDLLIFALVGLAHFLVYILRGHSERSKRIAVSNPAPRSYVRKSANPKRIRVAYAPRVYVRKSANPKRLKDYAPRAGDGPFQQNNQHSYFEKRLSVNAFANDRTRYFELPKPFLRVHGDQVGDKVELVVPNKSRVWSIKVYKYVNEDVLPDGPRIYLSDGWQEFLRDNWLEPGDLLGFFLTAHSKFLVTIVSRALGKNE